VITLVPHPEKGLITAREAGLIVRPKHVYSEATRRKMSLSAQMRWLREQQEKEKQHGE